MYVEREGVGTCVEVEDKCREGKRVSGGRDVQDSSVVDRECHRSTPREPPPASPECSTAPVQPQVG